MFHSWHYFWLLACPYSPLAAVVDTGVAGMAAEGMVGAAMAVEVTEVEVMGAAAVAAGAGPTPVAVLVAVAVTAAACVPTRAEEDVHLRCAVDRTISPVVRGARAISRDSRNSTPLAISHGVLPAQVPGAERNNEAASLSIRIRARTRTVPIAWHRAVLIHPAVIRNQRLSTTISAV